MKIFITVPTLSIPHGGIRIIIEWANRLSKWHKIGLYSLAQDSCNWCKISDKVELLRSDSMSGYDCLIITSPHSIDFESRKDTSKKVFIFAQMAEDLFSPNNSEWTKKCKRFANSKNPMFSISQWNIEHFKKQGRVAETHYIGNGVNLDDFPISTKPKDGKTVLIEGWECYNNAKDVNLIGHKVAKKLKDAGYYVIAYSQFPITKDMKFLNEYYNSPSLKALNELYERATILVKASKYDARSCAPMEAMTKGTVTARAIEKGDDDLISGENCIKVGYDEIALYGACSVLLHSEMVEKREIMAQNCIEYVQKYNWDYWMEIINNILCED